jgi:hypothetical protein
MQIVNNVITIGAQAPSYACARSDAAARESDYVIDLREFLEYWRDPVFQKDVDVRVWQKPLEG